ncbi:MAG TPA: ElyC/SanA/YdcF family protein [Nitrospirota bacterium]|nr:ElyC/SanA/YdcF family protein [Nitrospirota bacterium]
MREKKVIRYLLSILLLLALVILLLLPGYLAYSDSPRPADAVILLVGPEFVARRRKACQVAVECRARYLIVPAYMKVFPVTAKQLSDIKGITDEEIALFYDRRKRLSYKPYFEDTHVEILAAKRLMDDYGLKSAVFVSSEYHMRRIRLIAQRVFGDAKYAIACIPARVETPDGKLFQVKQRIYWMLSESVKICWFFAYEIMAHDKLQFLFGETGLTRPAANFSRYA